MSLDADYAVASDPQFIQRFQMALVSTALSVQSEAVSAANHQARSVYAVKVLGNPLGYAQLMAPAATVDGNANLSTTDANLEARASAIFNAFAVTS